MNQCGKCQAPTDTYLCWDCTKALRKILLELEEMVDELEVQVTKQAVGAPNPGGKAAEIPLPFDVAASDTADVVFETLHVWLAEVLAKWSQTETPLGVDAYTRARRHVRWLLDSVIAISSDENAAMCVEELSHALRLAYRAIDRQIHPIPLGVCECSRSILARPWKKVVICNGCGAAYDVQARRANFRQMGRDQIVTAGQAIALGELYGKQLSASTIRSWVRRGRLTAQQNPQGVNLYRFGDLLDLCREGVADEAYANRVEVEGKVPQVPAGDQDITPDDGQSEDAA